jgi:hypothetical protein
MDIKDRENIRELVKEVIVQEKLGDWVKDKGEKTWNTTKKVGKAIGREAKETLVASKILIKLIKNKKEPTKKEIEFLKAQSKDLGKSLALIGLQLIPGSSVAIITLEKALKKHGLSLFPKKQELPD